jgi:hypothetical protein
LRDRDGASRVAADVAEQVPIDRIALDSRAGPRVTDLVKAKEKRRLIQRR